MWFICNEKNRESPPSVLENCLCILRFSPKNHKNCHFWINLRHFYTFQLLFHKIECDDPVFFSLQLNFIWSKLILTNFEKILRTEFCGIKLFIQIVQKIWHFLGVTMPLITVPKVINPHKKLFARNFRISSCHIQKNYKCPRSSKFHTIKQGEILRMKKEQNDLYDFRSKCYFHENVTKTY